MSDDRRLGYSIAWALNISRWVLYRDYWITPGDMITATPIARSRFRWWLRFRYRRLLTIGPLPMPEDWQGK